MRVMHYKTILLEPCDSTQTSIAQRKYNRVPKDKAMGSTPTEHYFLRVLGEDFLFGC